MVNEQIRFDASSSYDPDGRLLNYSWEFGNGGMQFGPGKVYTYFTFTSAEHSMQSSPLSTTTGRKALLMFPSMYPERKSQMQERGVSLSSFRPDGRILFI